MNTAAQAGGAEARITALVGLGARLLAEGRAEDALPLMQHLAAWRPDRADVRIGHVTALGGVGRTLEALEELAVVRTICASHGSLLPLIQAQAAPAIEKFNTHLAAGEIEAAEGYVAAIARLTPLAVPILETALACNQQLGRLAEAERYALMLEAAEPGHPKAQAALRGTSDPDGQAEAEIARRLAALAAPVEGQEGPLMRLRDLHDLAGLILCRRLTPAAQAQLAELLTAAEMLETPAPAGSEWEAWTLHYRTLVEALDMEAALAPSAPAPDEAPQLQDARGESLDWPGLRRQAEALGAQAVFFVAADMAYVELYARWYVLSVLRYCDVPCLIVVHVIGGQGRMDEVRALVGVDDERLVFSADGFDAASVTTACYDAPPKGLIGKPVAHLQSARFQKLGPLLRAVDRPVFVSDIDLLLQRGVKDLLERCAEADVVFNENRLTQNAGSRITANLLLLRPTPNAERLLGFLKRYLDDRLGRERVTRWIDQVALVLGRHNLEAHAETVKLDYFDVSSDINNVMYPSYQAHPFRFLSLYHGFDTSSLEDPRVLGEGAAA